MKSQAIEMKLIFCLLWSLFIQFPFLTHREVLGSIFLRVDMQVFSEQRKLSVILEISKKEYDSFSWAVRPQLFTTTLKTS